MIRLNDITKVFMMGNVVVKAIDHISLNISRSEFVAIVGPSGSGKSTLMNIIGCLDTPNSGSYHIFGQDVNTMSDIELSKTRNENIGFVFQTFNLLPRVSALKNVALPLLYAGIKAKERNLKAKILLEQVGLGDRLRHKPNELSGGQRQRVAIARALVNNPSLIIADEPTGNLDSETGKEIMNFLKNLHERGNTIILVTHEKEIALMAQRQISLLDGRINS